MLHKKFDGFTVPEMEPLCESVQNSSRRSISMILFSSILIRVDAGPSFDENFHHLEVAFRPLASLKQQ